MKKNNVKEPNSNRQVQAHVPERVADFYRNKNIFGLEQANTPIHVDHNEPTYKGSYVGLYIALIVFTILCMGAIASQYVF